MKTTTGGKISVLIAAVLLCGCSGEESAPSPGGDKPAVPATPPPPPPPTLPELVTPQLLEGQSSVAGVATIAWAKRQSPSKKITHDQVPAKVLAELAALITPLAKHETSPVAILVMKRGAKPVALEITYTYSAQEIHYDGFAGARIAGDQLTTNQAMAIPQGKHLGWDYDTRRDIDGDGVKDIIINFNRDQLDRDVGDTAGGLVVVSSRTGSAFPIHLTGRLDRPEIGSREQRLLSSCWAEIDKRQVLLAVVEERSELVTAPGPRVKPAAFTYGVDAGGRFGPVELFAGVVGSAKTTELMLEDWRNWIGDPKATPQIAKEPSASLRVAAPPSCPQKKRLAFIIPGMTTEPPADTGYALLAWPSLDRGTTMLGIHEAHLPDGALVKIGRAEGD